MPQKSVSDGRFDSLPPLVIPGVTCVGAAKSKKMDRRSSQALGDDGRKCMMFESMIQIPWRLSSCSKRASFARRRMPSVPSVQSMAGTSTLYSSRDVPLRCRHTGKRHLNPGHDIPLLPAFPSIGLMTRHRVCNLFLSSGH